MNKADVALAARRTDMMIMLVIFMLGTLLPVFLLSSPPAHSDTAHNLLSLRACAERSDCSTVGNELGFGGLWSGIFWNHVLAVFVASKVSWSNAFTVVAAINAAIAVMYYFHQRRLADRLEAAFGSAIIVFGSLLVSAAPALWNATMLPPLGALCAIFLCAAVERKNTGYFAGAWVVLALLVDCHPIGLLLVPLLSIATLFWAPKPLATMVLCPLAALLVDLAISPSAVRLNGIAITNHGMIAFVALAVPMGLGIVLRPKWCNVSAPQRSWCVMLGGLFSTFVLPPLLATMLHHPIATRYQGASIGFMALCATGGLSRARSFLPKYLPSSHQRIRYFVIVVGLCYLVGSSVQCSYAERPIAEVWRMDDAAEIGRQFSTDNLSFSQVHLQLRTPFSLHLLASIGASMPFLPESTIHDLLDEQVILLPHSFLKNKPTGWHSLPRGRTPASWIRMPSTIQIRQSRVCVRQGEPGTPLCESFASKALAEQFQSENTGYRGRTAPTLPTLNRLLPRDAASSQGPLRLFVEVHAQGLHSQRSFVLIPEAIPWEIDAVVLRGHRHDVHARCVVLRPTDDSPAVVEIGATISPERRRMMHIGFPALVDFDPNDPTIAPIANPENWNSSATYPCVVLHI